MQRYFTKNLQYTIASGGRFAIAAHNKADYCNIVIITIKAKIIHIFSSDRQKNILPLHTVSG
jgi:hypothetical protein